jgi:Zn-dependent protease
MLLFGHYTLSALISVIVILFFTMGLHEFGHAWTANYWGDPTPRENGKLTINPLAHIDWYGWLMIMIVGFGFAGSVALNPRRMRDPRWGNFWTSLAGGLANLALAIIFGILFRLFGDIQHVAVMLAYDKEPWELASYGFSTLPAFISQFLYIAVWMNAAIFFFTLFPLFPLDGYYVMQSLLPGYWLSAKQVPAFIRTNIPALSRFLQQPAYVWTEWRQATMYIFMGLIMLSFAATSTGLHQLDIIGLILRGPVSMLTYVVAGF